MALHRLSLKMAASVAGVTFAVLALAYVVLDAPPWIVAVTSVAVGAAAYALNVRLVGRRIDLARATLKQVRRHRFENLDAAHLPRGDELNALIRQVYHTGLALEKEIQELRKIEDYRREYLGDVSHELKTPIFAIQGFAETLLEGALYDDDVNRSFVEKIERNAKRLGNLARDLSEISRIETGELQMTVTSFELREVVVEVLESLEYTAREKGVALHEQVCGGLVLGDRERIRQVLVNLVDNAIKYNADGGNVEVVARRLRSGPVKVSVVDDGIGVAPADVPRLTQRFFRVDKSRSRFQGGTGLGLAIVKHILAAHGCTLVVDSTPGHGSTFGFTLPTPPA